MTQLSKLASLGIAKEATPGTWLAPTDFLPFTKADFEDTFASIKDESFRANDTNLQGVYQGVSEADWSIDIDAYPDLAGIFLRSIIGPDTVSAGISTTLSSSSSAGATSLSTAASVAALSYIQIDTGTNLEYAQVTAVSGTGPFTLTVSGAGTGGGLLFAHTSSTAVVSQTTHTFKPNPTAAKATYSLTVYDTTQTLSYSDVVFSDLGIKIDPKNAVTFSAKAKSFPSVVQSAQTPAYSQPQPLLGWQWTMVNAGASSTRGESLDLTLKRSIDVIHSSDGVQAPREIFQGSIDADGKYKAIFENQTDLNLYLAYTQSPCTATLQQPTSAGGTSLALTMSKSGWIKGKRDLGSHYLKADFDIVGVYNATDGGPVSAVLKNYRSASY